MVEKINRRVQYLAGVCGTFITAVVAAFLKILSMLYDKHLIKFLASLAFIFTGATLAWSSPAIPKFKSGEANVEITDAQCSWVVSLHSAGALLGCYFGQVLNERLGRRWTIFGSSVPGLLGACLVIVTKMPEVMYVGRFLMGMATGIIAVVTMIYVTEIADKEIRGAVGMTVQVMNNFGSLIMYSVGPFVSYTALNSILVSIPIVYVLACLWIPESPYYHLKDGRLDAAKKEFIALNPSKDEKTVDEQLGVMRVHVQESMENKTTFKELITNMKYRKAVYIVIGLKLLQYMTGILVIQSYVEVIFRQSKFVSGPTASIIYGFVQILAGICATFLTRRFGRRILMFTSCLGVSISMTIVGLYFYLVDQVKIQDPNTLSSLSSLPLVGIISFNILYANGIGNLPYVMQAELFPVNVKGVASSTATMLACILGFAVTLCYQSVKDAFGHFTVFWTFAFIGYVGLIFIYFVVPETKDKTLEEVQDNMVERQPEGEALRTEKGES